MFEARNVRRRPTVVVIDHDASTRALVKFHLSTAGYEVLEGSDPVEGGRLVVRMLPDLVICDVDAPNGSGYDLVSALKSQPATQDIPVVFLSAGPKGKSPTLGATACLRKPVSGHRLLQVVEILARP